MKASLFVTSLILFGHLSYAQVKARFELPSGEKVVLYNDKTWDYAANLQLDRYSPIVMPKPSFTGAVLDSGKLAKYISLERISYEPHRVFEDNKWLTFNNLKVNRKIYPERRPPYYKSLHKSIPKYLNQGSIQQHITDSNYHILTYTNSGPNNFARYLAVLNADLDSVIKVIDFTQYTHADADKRNHNDPFVFTQQSISWAKCIHDTLYVSHHHRTYSDSSGGQNGYITCIDLKTMNVIWRSESLMSNAQTFVVWDDFVFCGYGFTKEPDYLYTLNRYTGEVMDQIMLKNAARYIVKKDDDLYVRTYDRNYVFKIKTVNR